MLDIELNGAPLPPAARRRRWKTWCARSAWPGQALALAVNRQVVPRQQWGERAPGQAGPGGHRARHRRRLKGEDNERRLTDHRGQDPIARACWSAAASTATSTKHAKRPLASGAEIVTVAIRRVNIGQDPQHAQPARRAAAGSLHDPAQYRRLLQRPRTRCYTLQMARELLGGHKLVKLEVLGDPKTLFPHMPETLRAAEILVRDGFDVMVYCSDDPVQATHPAGDRLRRRDAAGFPDRLGHGHPQSVEPVADHRAGHGAGAGRRRRRHGVRRGHRHGTGLRRRADEHAPSPARRNPVRMARAMQLAVQAGRAAFLAGRMPQALRGRRLRRRWQGRLA